ncbi:MAG: acyl--CoA ligase [Clostridiales bacterium]|nr:acyl--CoA ligase [Clostridiales bacterium]
MQKPWLDHYDPKMNESVEYPEKNMYEMLLRTVQVFPHHIALSFEGARISYVELLDLIETVERRLRDLGMKKGDVLTICLPNIPQAVIVFYAANKHGVIANMVHPKTPPDELAEFMTTTNSRYLIILDAFMFKSIGVFEKIAIEKVIVARIGDFLSPVKRAGFYWSKGRKIPAVPDEERFVLWKDLMVRKQCDREGEEPDTEYQRQIGPHDPAVYLHSGGTTGSPKTIILSSHNMNVLAVIGPQIVNIDDPFETGTLPEGFSMVAILPLFHGFGLCMCMHTMLCNGIKSILVPLFTPDSLAKVILREKPALIAAVPTLFEGMLKSKLLARKQLPFLKACFCGGDSLSPDLKMRFESFVRERGAPISLREGYGLTETVTVCCVNPEYKSKEGSIGLPLPDILMKIVHVGTHQELSPGGQGEICVSGPTTMLGYLNDPQATNEAIHIHDDEQQWVHTGDYGYMDKEGYFFFTQRLKRIIKVSGVPVFPSQIEAIISAVLGVDSACAIAIPDSYRIHAVKAVIVLNERGHADGQEAVRERIKVVCGDKLISYARPVEIEFRERLPKTLVGKVDYVLLEKQELEKRSGNS